MALCPNQNRKNTEEQKNKNKTNKKKTQTKKNTYTQTHKTKQKKLREKEREIFCKKHDFGVMVKMLTCKLEVNPSSVIMFTFELIPLGKVWHNLSSQLWVRYYHRCSFRRMALALNNPQRLICYYKTNKLLR